MTSVSTDFDIAVVGAGAAGIMAALTARQAGANVCLLEKTERLGKKILISGGGKCNLTNMEIDHSNFHGSHPRFVMDVLRRFTNYDLIDWIESLGVPTIVDERNGKVWPEAMLSKVVMKALANTLFASGVKVQLNAALKGLVKSDEGVFELALANGSKLRSKTVILATGGRAAPHLGADGSGLAIAESLGHNIVETFPALVGLEANEQWMQELQGITCEDVALGLLADGKEVASSRGSLLFTHYGVNSPAIFRLSREVEPALKDGKEVALSINFNPSEAPTQEAANKLLDELLGSHTKKRTGTVLGYAFGARSIGDAMAREIGFDPERRVRELQKKHRDLLKVMLFKMRIGVLGTQGFERAEVMRGGVNVREVDPRTFASKVVDGLFVCGEMLDIDGDVGGYNFQFAFGSGKSAAEAALDLVGK
ncbi:MAG: aminoacetone oxidase family FAD-binding enzyme [Planctomycetes bacterium]|nr:aminoacetone oxidase family FAD-binding enzyme [Planctomycetota bacterium]